jgi:hypothetical protein
MALSTPVSAPDSFRLRPPCGEIKQPFLGVSLLVDPIVLLLFKSPNPLLLLLPPPPSIFFHFSLLLLWFFITNITLVIWLDLLRCFLFILSTRSPFYYLLTGPRRSLCHPTDTLILCSICSISQSFLFQLAPESPVQSSRPFESSNNTFTVHESLPQSFADYTSSVSTPTLVYILHLIYTRLLFIYQTFPTLLE